MATSEEQAANWRLVEQYKSAEELLGAIQEIAKEYSDRLSKAAEVLSDDPLPPADCLDPAEVFVASVPPGHEVLRLVRERKKAKKELARLRPDLERLNLPKL
jgi:hypothetical protein